MNQLNKINDIFGIDTGVDLPIAKTIPIDYSPSEIEQDDDYQLARSTLRGLINKNEDVLTELIHISKNSEHPRAFEVAGQLIKTQTEVARELMNVHKQRKEIEKTSSKTVNQQNNILFAGSTSELLKLIASSRS